MEVAKNVYVLVKKLPKEETYALSDQMRRAAVSIPSNIAEGQGRASSREFSQFLSIARGSALELETQLQLCVMIQYLNGAERMCPNGNSLGSIKATGETVKDKYQGNSYSDLYSSANETYSPKLAVCGRIIIN